MPAESLKMQNSMGQVGGAFGWWEPNGYGLILTTFWEVLLKWTVPRGLHRICLGERWRQDSGMS